ncbi:MAG TPA: PLP-dependent aminotransferase family protein [Streptosporangiaceae bacterium]|jgi:GntR family transcriptional regulator/MocR family aminotransferase
MAAEWTNSAPALLLRLDRGSPVLLRSQLEQALRERIQSGVLSAGDALPPSRRLAADLAVSRGLVVDCYAQLAAEGYLTSRVGSATRVAVDARPLLPAEPGTEPAADQPGPAAAQPAPAELESLSPQIEFRPGVPDLSGFPRRDWLWAMGEACRTAAKADLTYGDPRGSATLRQVLAAYLRRVRGAVADPERMVICAGFAQGLGLILRALAAQGACRVAVEEPGPAYREIVAGRAGVQAVPVPVDAYGIDVDALAAADVSAVVVTPAHQAPTGVVLAPQRRHALLAWARRHDALVIEDDYDSEFRYDREPVGTLQGLAPDRVALLGSVSKPLAPALRLGWIVCPARLAGPLAHGKRYDDRGCPALDQLALAALLDSGRFDRNLRRNRTVYAARRQALVDALRVHAPSVEVSGLAAGFHAVAGLPGQAGEAAVISAARARSVGLHGMSGFRFDGATRPPQLVLGFGNLTEGAIERGIAAVGDLLNG